MIKNGDYVVATKYKDGDPKDHFVVGFYKGITWHGRYNIVDESGKLFRHNGFRRVQVVSEEVGSKIISNAQYIELSGLSVWHFVRLFRRGIDL